jgi:hypothetical protein
VHGALLAVRVGDASSGEDVGQLLNVRAAEDCVAVRVLLPQAVHQLRAQRVDLAVEDAPLVGDLLLVLRELLDQLLELLIRESAEVWERVDQGDFRLGVTPV